jgi:hypothetical protein
VFPKIYPQNGEELTTLLKGLGPLEGENADQFRAELAQIWVKSARMGDPDNTHAQDREIARVAVEALEPLAVHAGPYRYVALAGVHGLAARIYGSMTVEHNMLLAAIICLYSAVILRRNKEQGCTP